MGTKKFIVRIGGYRIGKYFARGKGRGLNDRLDCLVDLDSTLTISLCLFQCVEDVVFHYLYGCREEFARKS